MSFIEMTGATLRRALHEDEIQGNEFTLAHVSDDTIVRVNHEGDIEVRRQRGWEVVGGLLGGFEERIRHETGLDWA
jgi:hypothetical protein